MKVRFLYSVCNARGVFAAGQEVEYPDGEAESLIGAGVAIEVRETVRRPVLIQPVAGMDVEGRGDKDEEA